MKTIVYPRTTEVKMTTIFLTLALFILSFGVAQNANAQDQQTVKVTQSYDGKYFIVSNGDGQQVNYSVQSIMPAAPLSCAEIVPQINLDKYLITKTNLVDNQDLIRTFSANLFRQLNTLYQLELYMVYTTKENYEIQDFYFNNVLNRTKVRTDESVLVFKFDNTGKLNDADKRARASEIKEYREKMRIDQEYLNTYDKIEKFASAIEKSEDMLTAQR